MKNALIVGGAVAIALAGFVLGRRWDAATQPAAADGPRESSAKTTAQRSRWRSPQPPTLEAPRSPQPSSPEEELERLRAKVALQEYLLEGFEGEVYGELVAWPAATDENESFMPDSFQRNVNAAIEACSPPAELVGVDCSEPPCMALLRTAGDRWYEALVNSCAAWSDRYGSAVTLATVEVTCGDGRTESVAMLSPYWEAIVSPSDPTARENMRKRLRVRRAQVRAEWVCAAAPAL